MQSRLRKVRAPVLALLLVGATIAIAYSFGLLQRKADECVLVANQDDLQWGVLYANTIVSRPLHVQNVGRRPIDIEGFMTSCGCAGLEPGRCTILPSATQVFTVVLDLSVYDRSGPRVSNEELAVRITPKVKGSTSQVEPWFLRATLDDLLVLQDGVLDLGIVPRSRLPIDHEIRFRASKKLHSLRYQVGSKNQEQVATLLRDDHRLYTVAIPIREGSGQSGSFVEELTLRPQLQGESSSTLRFRWQVRGTIREDVWVHPTSFQWGAQSVGSTCIQVLTLESYQQQAFAVEKIACPDGDVQVENQPSTEPGRQRVTLRQAVRKTGLAEATVTIHVRLDGGRLVAICVPVSGYGLDKLQ